MIPKPPSLTNSRRFIDSPVRRVSALITFRDSEFLMMRSRRAVVVLLLALSTSVLAAQIGGFQRRFVPPDESETAGDSKHEFAWSRLRYTPLGGSFGGFGGY